MSVSPVSASPVPTFPQEESKERDWGDLKDLGPIPLRRSRTPAPGPRTPQPWPLSDDGATENKSQET